jgi:EAL domain-containing protein (putative c-di-GMP-specific phosphodiesterase class I)
MLRSRMDRGERVVPVSCNFSRRHFVEPGFPDALEKVLDKYQIPKRLIEVEITETVIIEELQRQIVQETLDELRRRHVTLSIDDFGSGYSSLGVFERVPAEVIKLDRSFFLNQRDRNRQVAIMRNIVSLADNLDTKIVCEGVETKEDVSLMQEIGAYVAQGYFFSRPEPQDAFEQRMEIM